MNIAPPVYIVIVNWNGMDHLESCLRSVAMVAYPNYRIILVDNGSKDGSVEYVEANFPAALVIENRKNLGFCVANNQGMRYAVRSGAKYVALLNNDTEVDPGWLHHLVCAAENDSTVGALSSKMLMYHHRSIINSTGVDCTPFGNAVDIRIGRCDGARWSRPREVLTVCGGAFFVRCDVLCKVGLFQNYTIYLEDVDLCLRIWNAGYRIMYVPDAVVYHKFSVTMGNKKEFKRKVYLNTRNRLWIIFKHYPLSKAGFILTRLVWLGKRIITENIRTGTYWKATIELKALLYTILLLPYFATYRASRFLKGTGRCRFWHLIDLNGTYYPRYLLPERREIAQIKAPRQVVIMGQEECSLGNGWYEVAAADGKTFR